MTATMPRQLALGFDHRPSLSGDDFLVAPCNAEAVAWLDRWPDWRLPALAVYGPSGCGKTHLAQVFMARTGAPAVTVEALRTIEAPRLLGDAPACLIEDAEAVLAAGVEAAVLHLFNTVGEAGRHLLLTARRPPARWAVGLADLRSRLNAAAVVAIGAPDDALLAAVLVKLFADRQLRVEGEVISFMLARMERSFDAARRLVAALDAAALAGRRNLTVPLVREVLGRGTDAQGEG